MFGGALWVLLWVHFLLTHGPTSSDYKETFLGLSYYDSTKLVVFALALCIVGLVSLRARRPSSDWPRLGTLGYFMAIAGLVAIIVGVAADLWTVPWGDTTRTSTDLTNYAWGGVAIATLTAFLGLTLLGTSVVRTKVLPSWTILPLSIAGLAAIPWLHHTLHGVLIGLCWLMVGYALWRSDSGLGKESTP